MDMINMVLDGDNDYEEVMVEFTPSGIGAIIVRGNVMEGVARNIILELMSNNRDLTTGGGENNERLV